MRDNRFSMRRCGVTAAIIVHQDLDDRLDSMEVDVVLCGDRHALTGSQLLLQEFTQSWKRFTNCPFGLPTVGKPMLSVCFLISAFRKYEVQGGQARYSVVSSKCYDGSYGVPNPRGSLPLLCFVAGSRSPDYTQKTWEASEDCSPFPFAPNRSPVFSRIGKVLKPRMRSGLWTRTLSLYCGTAKRSCSFLRPCAQPECTVLITCPLRFFRRLIFPGLLFSSTMASCRLMK